MKKESYIFFLCYFGIFIFVFRSLIFNLSTNLIDWLDYAFVNWIISQDITKIASFQFTNFFNTNAFYPHPFSLFFSDTFLPQAIIGLPFALLNNNPILIFNIIFIVTFILNYLSSYLFWGKLFKNNFLAFIGALFTVFSPFFHLELGHFQMMSYWPFFFTLYFLFKDDISRSTKNAVFVGLFLSIQFLASVYLSIYLIFFIFLYFLLKVVRSKVKFQLVKSLLLILAIFILLDGIFILGYINMKNYYQIHRDLGELVTYSAPISDYLFTKNINSIIHDSDIMTRWNSFDKNNVGGQTTFPGFLLFFLSIFGLFKFAKNKQFLSLNISFKNEIILFAMVLISGVIFSLGPRLNFNGSYAYIPAPYNLVTKLIPFIEAARAPSRWSFLFYTAIIYFALVSVKKLQTKSYFKYIALGGVLIFFLEYIPINIQTHSEEYINNHYIILKEVCSKQKKAILEIPVTHLDVYPTIGDGVKYISKVELSSIYHKCYLINGYSGYDMPSILELSDTLKQSVKQQDLNAFIYELKKNQVDIIKVNPEYLPPDLKEPTLYLLENGTAKGDFQQIDDRIFIIN